MRHTDLLHRILTSGVLVSLTFSSVGCASITDFEKINPYFHFEQSTSWQKIRVPKLAFDEHFNQQLEKGRLTWDQDFDRSKAIEKQVNSLISKGDFQALEGVAQHYRTVEPSFSSGSGTVSAFYESILNFYMGFEHGLKEGHYYSDEPFERFISRWKKAYPHSDTAQVALAKYYYVRGWKIRGSGFVNKVKEKELQTFQEYITKAKSTLLAVEHPDSLPEYYDTQIELSDGLPVTGGEVQEFLQEGVKHSPKYWPLYHTTIRFLLYRWFGQNGDLNRYAQWAATQPNAPYSPLIMYARIANTTTGYTTNAKEFLSYDFSWPHVRAGYLLLAKEGNLYPPRLRSFLWMAVLYKDKDTAKVLFKIPEVYSDAWKSKERFLKAKQWANSAGEYPNEIFDDSDRVNSPQ